MNGYELVRLQPQQVKKSGDTITGNLTATGGAKFVGNLQGNADTATRLQTARQINGTNFNGSGNITTANWGTARSIQIGNSAKQVNGGSNVTWTLTDIGAAASNHTHNGGNVNLNGYTKPNQSSAISPNDTLNQAIGKLEAGLGSHTHNYAGSNTPGGVATSAHKLQTARNIQVGNTAKAFDGTSNISFSLQDIGASASNHNHDNAYLKLTGGTMSGSILANPNTGVNLGGTNNRFGTTYTNILDLGNETGIYTLANYLLTFMCGHNRGGEKGEIYYSHSGQAYHIEPKWSSNNVAAFFSTGLGRSSNTWRDVWTHLGHNQTSDITKKENIKKIVSDEEIAKSKKTKDISLLSSNSIAETVKNIQPITFDYKNMVKTLEDGSIAEDDEISKSARQLGISAQQLEQLNPDLFEYVGNKITVENEDGDLETNYSIKTLAYTNMLLVALQETMKKVELLEKEVVELKSKI